MRNTKYRYLTMLSLLTSCLAGCGAASPSDEGAWESSTEPLMANPGLVPWSGRIAPSPSAPIGIGVYIGSDPVVTNKDGGTYHAADAVMQALKGSWEAVANLRFQRLATRPSSGKYVDVQLSTVPSMGGIGGDTDILGDPGSNHTTVRMSVCSLTAPPEVTCSPPPNGGSIPVCQSIPQDCTYGFEMFRETVMHEFGHVLGFNHEHQRFNSPTSLGNWCGDATEAVRNSNGNSAYVNGRYLTRLYDNASVMDYCRDQNEDQQPDGYRAWDTENDRLSDGDVEGVRVLYGAHSSVADSNLYLVQGSHIWRADDATGSYANVSGTVDWSGATSIATVDQALFVIQAGYLHRVNPIDGSYTLLGPGWGGWTAMAGLSESLYVIQANRLWQVYDLTTGATRRVGTKIWSGVTSMAQLNGSLYIIQNGSLRRFDPVSGADEVVNSDDWLGPTVMTAMANHLYIVQGDELWRFDDVKTGSYRSLGGGWSGATSLTQLNGWLYVVQGDALWRADPNNGGYAFLGDDWGGPTVAVGLR